LLEINQQIVQRDKSLKLERSLASSLNEDYITQLSAANRTIRELQEKVRGLEGVHASTKNTLEKQLYDKVGCDDGCWHDLIGDDRCCHDLNGDVMKNALMIK
jgi:hypothetical protein